MLHVYPLLGYDFLGFAFRVGIECREHTAYNAICGVASDNTRVAIRDVIGDISSLPASAFNLPHKYLYHEF
jgi:hypothetical protein